MERLSLCNGEGYWTTHQVITYETREKEFVRGGSVYVGLANFPAKLFNSLFDFFSLNLAVYDMGNSSMFIHQ
jgi:hypothetical protein